eukprot:RCo038476
MQSPSPNFNVGVGPPGGSSRQLLPEGRAPPPASPVPPDDEGNEEDEWDSSEQVSFLRFKSKVLEEQFCRCNAKSPVWDWLLLLALTVAWLCLTPAIISMEAVSAELVLFAIAVGVTVVCGLVVLAGQPAVLLRALPFILCGVCLVSVAVKISDTFKPPQFGSPARSTSYFALLCVFAVIFCSLRYMETFFFVVALDVLLVMSVRSVANCAEGREALATIVCSAVLLYGAYCTERRLRESIVFEKKAGNLKKRELDFMTSHCLQLSTPINGILGFTQLLRETPLLPDQHNYLDSIHSATEYLVSISSNMLDYNKIKMGLFELEKIPFNLDSVIESVVRDAAGVAIHKGIDIHLFLPPVEGGLCHVIGDPKHIRFLFFSYTSNALKFTQQHGGPVNIHVTFRELPAGRNQSHSVQITVEIQDHGQGLTKQEQQMLYADNPHTTNTLAIVKMLVKMMDGEVGVDSQLKMGTTCWFTILLPLQDNALAKHCPLRFCNPGTPGNAATAGAQ